MDEEPSCARTRSISSSKVCMKDEPEDTPEEDHPMRSNASMYSCFVSLSVMSCSHCKKTLVEGRSVYQRKSCPDLFCSAACLSAATQECHNCFKLIERPQSLILAPVDDRSTTKPFCCNDCLSSFNHKRTILNKISSQPQPSQPLCSVCNRHCFIKHELTLDGAVHKICSDDCLLRFRTANNLTVSYCANCDSSCFYNIINLNLHDGNRTLCSDECLSTFKRRVKTPSACIICKTYRQTSDMFDVKDGGNVSLLCSKSCVIAYKIQAARVSDVSYPCDNCGKTTLPAYHVALSNESIKNFCSLPCAMAFQTNSQKAVETDAPPTTSSCKIQKNKAILCKPMVQDVGVSCTTQVVNNAAQTDGVFPKVIFLPIPLPVFIPVPGHLFTTKPPSLPVQECPGESSLPKIGKGPTASSLSRNDRVQKEFCGRSEEPEIDGYPTLSSELKEKFDDVAAFNSDESCGGDYLPDADGAEYSDAESISKNTAEETFVQNKPLQKGTKKLDDTAAFSSNESFSGDYVPDSVLHSDSETPINKQKLPCLENTSKGSKSFDDLDNEMMDSGNERDPVPNPAPGSASPPQKRSRGRPRKILTEKSIVPQEQHTYTTKNYCYFCGEAKTKFARHLEMVHKKTEPDVAKAFSFHKNSKERRRLIDILRDKGNHKHNQEVLQKQCGMLKLRRKYCKTGKPTVTCQYCKGIYVRRHLWKHLRNCSYKPPSLPVQECPEKSRSTKIGNGPTASSLSQNDRVHKPDDTAAFSSDESFSGDYVPDSALHSDSETPINKQKLPSLENTKSFDDLSMDNEAMDSGNERDPMPNPAPGSTSPPQKRSRGRPPKRKNQDDMTASSSEESCSEEHMPDSEPEPCNDSDSSSSLSAIKKQRLPRLRKSTINKRLPFQRKKRRVTESVEGKILREKSSVPQEQHTYATKNYCYFCGEAQSKFARHLKVHKKTEPDVAKAFSFHKNSKERRRLIDILRDKGNHKHNQEVLEKQCGMLKLRRKPKKTGKPILRCPFCKGIFVRSSMWRHIPNCRSNTDTDRVIQPGRRRIIGMAVVAEIQSAMNSQHSPETLNVLAAMRQDEVSVAVQNDVHILELAQDLCNKHAKDPTKSEYIRSILRALGRLALTMKKKESSFSLEDAVKPYNVDKVIEAMKEVSGFDKQRQSYQKPSLALKLERGLLKISDIILSRTIAADDKQKVEEVQEFQQVFASKWAEHAPQVAPPTQVIKPLTIPFTHDVQLLYKYIQKKAAEAIEDLKKEDSPKTYAALAKVTLAQICMFNKCHTSDIANMTVESFMGRVPADDHTDTACLLSELEQKLCTNFSRVDMICRFGRKVSALLTPDACSAVMLLVEKRITCGISESNPFVFVRPKCSTPYRGHDSIRICASECGAQGPQFLTSRYFRKHIGTLFQILNLQNNELCHLGTFFKCAIRADRDFYLLPEAALEIAKISRLVQEMEQGHLKEFQGKSLDELEIDDEIEPDMPRNIANDSADEGEEEDEESDHPLQLKGKRTRVNSAQAEPSTSPPEEPSTSTGQALDAPQVALSTQPNKRPLTVPFTHDVQLLYRYLQKKAAEALESLKREDSRQTYSELAKVTLSQIMIFNKLHASEVSEMTIKDFMERTWAEVRDTDTAFVLSEFEQKLCTHFSRVDITCKSGRKVAVLLNPEVDSAVMLLVKKRVTCDVSVTNPLLFCPPNGHGHDYFNGQTCIKTFASECGAQRPECLRSRYFRKHVGTLFHILNLKNHDLCKLATLLGCDIRANRDFYQLPGAALEIAKISKLVQEMEHGYLWKFQGKSLDELEIDDEMEPDLAWDTANNDDDEEEDEELVQPVKLKAKPKETLNEVTSSRDGKKKKNKWTDTEVNAIMKHFKVHISKGQLATVTESRQCRDAEYVSLKHRTVQNIRDFVRNRGITLKKSK